MVELQTSSPPERVMEAIRARALAVTSKKTTYEQRVARVTVEYNARCIEAKQRCQDITADAATELAGDSILRKAGAHEFQMNIDQWNRQKMQDLKTEAEIQRRVGAEMRDFLDHVVGRLDQLAAPSLLAAPAPLPNGLVAASAE